ncbi:alpha/beta hydrolase [Nocardia sp. CDC159]|uniref:Alpha/beta hydrolase n=1 Tax=Nocardia pulmonis TaxID=2951408 RepID=A0A9X2IVY7_9NOCA|nr:MULTISPECIES: alpha/beta fold hydrolase [Nocardia]MCM6774382.1 alpha/beta hydrolase [Nocardia pulmonis]MCM6787552.1 alpha/beta hydrolase [Nocardia sp. CDC159]
MRWSRAALLVSSSLTVVLTAACGAGPSNRPGVAVERPHEAAAPATTSTAPAPPALELPKTDLRWRDCAATTFDKLGLGAPPAGVVFECAEYSTPIDAGGSVLGTFRTAATRAKLANTPADAPPVVLTSGGDRSSTATLAGLAAGPNSAVLAAHPVVAVDRRGLGGSQAIECMPFESRRGMTDAGQFAAGDPIEAMMKFSQDATVACQDFLQPYQRTFDAPHAADDIEQLRKQWQVDRIALVGTGSGARVALSYAAKYGDHLARLIMDAPQAVDADAVTRAEQRVRGAEAALDGFAQRCAAMGCALGADPRGAITELVNRARGGGLGELSAGALLTAVSAFLGDPRADQPDRVGELADALAAAGRGDRHPIGQLVQRASAAIGSDGQFVTRCSDNQQPATPDRVRELERGWAAQYPVFGRDAAVRLMTCAAWPTPNPTQLPDKLPLPVLLLGTTADPVTGGEALPTVTGALGRVGATTATVRWQGWGHPVLTHSGCAQQAVDAYLKDAKLPADGTACPA